MSRKSIHSMKKNASTNSGVVSQSLQKLAVQIQQDLQNNQYESALSESRELEQALKEDAENATIFLTSLVWQVRALQGLKADFEVLEQAVDHYAQESNQHGDIARCIQAYRIKAQLYIDRGSWTIACEHLENALNLAIEHQMGRATLEILMHLSALELKLCHYCEAIDYLSRAMNAIKNAGVVPDDLRELSAVGQRQLCELYDTIGDGGHACDALEAAQNAHTHDPEEIWMQTLWVSRFDMRSGDADSACTRLKKLESDIRKEVKSGKARSEQLIMVEIERAQALWNHGDFEEAVQKLDELEAVLLQPPMRKVVALTRFQWGVESGKPHVDPDEMSRRFSEICNQSEETDIQILLAAALAQASLEIDRGHYDVTLESLLHIAQTAAFTQLIPFATRALAMRGQIHLAQGNYSQAAIDGKDACETFVEHVDDVSARLAAALMIRAQCLASSCDGICSLDDAEKSAIQQLKGDLERYEMHHHQVAFLDLGLQLAQLAALIGDSDWLGELIHRLEPHIQPKWMAHRAMTFYRIKANFAGDESLRQKSREIAEINGFVQ